MLSNIHKSAALAAIFAAGSLFAGMQSPQGLPKTGGAGAISIPRLELDTNTLALWRFDSIDSGYVRDESNNKFDARVFGAPQVVEALQENGLLFSGKGQYLDVGRWPILSNYKKITVEVVIKPSSIPVDGTAGGDALVEIFNDQHWYPTRGIVIRYNNSYAQFAAGYSGWSYVTSGNKTIMDTWHYLKGTIDNELQTIEISENFGPPVVTKTSTPFVPSILGFARIAACSVDPASRFFQGIIDEIKVTAEPSDSLPDPKIPPDGILARWTFDSTSGNQCDDVTGNGHTMQDSSIVLREGVSGKAIELLGYPSIGPEVLNSSLDFKLNNLTISGWIYSYVDLNTPGSFFSFKDILSFRSTTVGLRGHYALYLNDRGKLVLDVATSGAATQAICESDTMLQPRTWYHVAGTYDGAVLKIFLDGKCIKERAYTGGITYPSMKCATIGGHYYDTDFKWQFQGLIDELAIYNKALSATEISLLYERDKPESQEAPFEINLGMKQCYAKADDSVWMPIFITNYEDVALKSMQFALQFDSSIIAFVRIERDSGLAGTWEMFNHNLENGNNLRMAMAGTQHAIGYGEGELLRILFKVNKAAAQGSFTDLIVSEVVLDEYVSVVRATTTSGKIIVGRQDIMWGDVTGNGVVTVVDAQKILEFVVGSLKLPDAACCPNFTTAVADVSGNGSITSYDAALVFQHCVGLLPSFPVEKGIGIGKKSVAFSFDNQAAHLSLSTPVRLEGNLYEYSVCGRGLKGLVAAELEFVVDGSIIEKVDRAVPSAYLKGAVPIVNRSEGSNICRIALTTNDLPEESEGDIFIIRAVHAQGKTGGGLLLKRAFLNEGKITTNLENSSLAESLATRSVRTKALLTTNNQLHIRGRILSTGTKITSHEMD